MKKWKGESAKDFLGGIKTYVHLLNYEKTEKERNGIIIEMYFHKAPVYVQTRMEGRLKEFKNIAPLAEFLNKLKADMTAWKEFSEDQEDGEDDWLNRVYENRRFNNLQIRQQDNIGNQLHQIPQPQPIPPLPPAFQAPLSHQDIMKM
uniref:Uncharacterized protein n=1 Tax=Romanomermis culicivorax TaxID=13658 RepID=A0A915IML3_ROMCU